MTNSILFWKKLEQHPATRVYVLVGLLLLSFSQIDFCRLPGLAANLDPAFETDMLNRYDWICYLDIDSLPNYLNYEGSTLNPIDRVIATYQQTPTSYIVRNAEVPATIKPIKYEELWYHAGRGYGLNRFVATPVQENEQVGIFLRWQSQNSSLDQTNAAASCAMRLLAETSANHSIVTAVIVPSINFETISSSFGRFHFFPVSKPYTGRSGALSFQLVSYPDGQERDFYFDSGRWQ